MNFSKNEHTFWVWLSLACGVASKDFGRLAGRYEPYELFEMSEEEIGQIDGIGDGLKAKLTNKKLEDAERIVEECRKHRVEIVSYADAAYPSRLRTIEDPPVVLYVKGELPLFEERPAVGVVGTRKMSEYGRKTAFDLSFGLAKAGAVIVSGLALGIDGVAACGALAAKGKTVAVLGCGVLVDYPKAHRALKQSIERTGAVISEYPPGEPANPYNFPKRNRIISGMCQGTLLVECALKSGSMITARLAISQGRQLFAVPGKIGDVGAEGPNALIQEGAYVAVTAKDILKHYEFLYGKLLDLRTPREIPDCDAALRYFGVPADYETGRLGRRETAVEAPKQEPKKQTKKESKQEIKQEIKQVPKETPKPTPSVALSSVEQSVLDRMPLDRPTPPDALCSENCGIGEVLTALTMLELYGVVTSLPGGLYIRK